MRTSSKNCARWGSASPAERLRSTASRWTSHPRGNAASTDEDRDTKRNHAGSGERSRTERHFALCLEYDGSKFSGWQRQPNARTVQGEIEAVLSQIAAGKVSIRGSGRTDAGVHALGQWASASLPTRATAAELRRSLHAMLPRGIRVRGLWESRAPLDALRQTVRKTYFYQYHVGPYLPPARAGHFGYAGDRLALQPMRRAAALLRGDLDFTSFAKHAAEQESCVRRMDVVRILPIPRGVRMYFTASGFLYNMVRILAAALREVGRGDWSVGQLHEVLKARDRALAPPPAPAQGLFLFRADWHCAAVASLIRDPGDRLPSARNLRRVTG